MRRMLPYTNRRTVVSMSRVRARTLGSVSTVIGILRRAARRTSLRQRWVRMDKEMGVALKDTRGRVVGEEILKDLCGSLLILGKLPKVF